MLLVINSYDFDRRRLDNVPPDEFLLGHGLDHLAHGRLHPRPRQLLGRVARNERLSDGHAHARLDRRHRVERERYRRHLLIGRSNTLLKFSLSAGVTLDADYFFS